MNFNPETYIKNIISQNTNPILKNLLQMGQQGKTQELNNFMRNFLKEKGYDFDEELKKLKENPLEYTRNLK